MNPDEQKKLDRLSSGGTEHAPASPSKQGISNRPGDEDPDTGVDPAPGPPQEKGSHERNK
jgi:hypothetical protein